MEPKASRKLFPSQRADEHVILVLRRHWLIWIKFVIQLAIFNLLPIVLFGFFYYFIGWRAEEGLLFVAIVLLTSIYYMGTWLMYFHQFVDYRLDVWILTDFRVINIEQQGLFDRIISELNISKVQDVTSEVHGHAQTFLDYGNVYVQTAGEKQRFIFQNVPHPEEISRLVTRATEGANKREHQTVIHHDAPARVTEQESHNGTPTTK